MRRRKLRRSVPASVALVSMFLAAQLPGGAQTWRWNSVTHSPNTPPLPAQSVVAVTGGELRMTYTASLQHRQVVIESCRAALADVGNASSVVTDGRAYLLIQLKPLRSAACASGSRPAVALPTDDRQFVARVAQEINRSCCSTGGVPASRATPKALARVTPAPKPTSLPTAPPSASPSASPAPKTTLPATSDWVESDGLFSFVRVRNPSRAQLTIRDATIFNCRDVQRGCGPLAAPIAIAPGRTVTLATLTSANQTTQPAFAYRFTAAAGDVTASRSGSSGKAPPRRSARMSAQEIRTAQAAALAGLEASSPAPAATLQPARLVQRGSSRLAIGQTGTALVRLTIAANGTPQEATIVSITNRRLSAAAIETAVSSTYAPALQNGKAVSAKYVATFSFNGEDPATASIPVWKRSPSPTPFVSPAPTAPAGPATTPAGAPLPAASPH